MNAPKAYILVVIATLRVPGKANVTKSHFYISDDHDEDPYFVTWCLEDLLDYYRRDVPALDIMHFWSDGASRHFKSAIALYKLHLMAKEKKCDIFRNFFQSNHGKGPKPFLSP